MLLNFWFPVLVENIDIYLNISFAWVQSVSLSYLSTDKIKNAEYTVIQYCIY